MDNKATLIAVSGVVAMGIGIIILGAISGKPVDSETIKLVVTGLMGFASGVGATVMATAKSNETPTSGQDISQ